jgi:glycosyltransferase involved in cell wall biosynthesis
MKPLPEQPALGVIVCCRNEERTVSRRLANLARSHWPPSRRRHRVVVVDDGSRDATVRLASAFDARAWPERVTVEVIGNLRRPGKSGAIATGVSDLGDTVDIVILTDADVVHAPDALARLAEACVRDPRVGMACGAQRFVSELPSDGSTDALGRGSGGSLYDRLTDMVRALETRSGRVFSVHGQLLAWRADLRLSPRSAFAADDLDLMLQARSVGARVVREPTAVFFEARPVGAVRRAQALRRARAYLQFATRLEPSLAPDVLTRWQWRAYCLLPAIPSAFWTIVWCLSVALIAVVAWASSLAALSAGSQWLLLLAATNLWLFVVSRLWRASLLIAEAKRLERDGTLDDQWSTTR